MLSLTQGTSSEGGAVNKPFRPVARTQRLPPTHRGEGEVSERYFGEDYRKRLETTQSKRQKAIQGFLSRFRWSPIGRIFDGLEAISECHFPQNELDVLKKEAPETEVSRF